MIPVSIHRDTIVTTLVHRWTRCPAAEQIGTRSFARVGDNRRVGLRTVERDDDVLGLANIQARRPRVDTRTRTELRQRGLTRKTSGTRRRREHRRHTTAESASGRSTSQLGSRPRAVGGRTPPSGQPRNGPHGRIGDQRGGVTFGRARPDERARLGSTTPGIRSSTHRPLISSGGTSRERPSDAVE